MTVRVYLKNYEGYPLKEIVVNDLAKNYKKFGHLISYIVEENTRVKIYYDVGTNVDIWEIYNICYNADKVLCGSLCSDIVYVDEAFTVDEVKDFITPQIRNSLTPAIVRFMPPVPRPAELDWNLIIE